MPRILVVDDQKIPRVAVAATLTEAGHEVITASRGEEGIDRAREWGPDVVVLDVHMPDMDGFGVVERLKADARTAPIPVIFLTATSPTDDLVVRGLELGAYDFLNKGCSRSELLARVEVMARIKRSHDELSAIARVSDTLIRTSDPARMAEHVARQTRDVFRAELGLLILTGDDSPDAVRATAGIDANDPLVDSLTESILGWLDSHDDDAAVVPFAELPEAGRDALEPHGLRSLLAAAVHRRNVPPMLLAVLSRREEGFRRDSDAALLHALARQAAIAIENALLHARARTQAAQLERAMTERSRFFASMSHELRTPVNALVGYNQLLLDGFFGGVTDRQREALGKLNRSAEHLLELINDVLDISKIEAGKVVISRQPTNLGALLRDTLTSVELQARQKGLELIVEAPERIPAVTDPARVRQILLNLLSNAVKFTASGSVRVALREARDTLTGNEATSWAECTVTDTGPGIPSEDLERIFKEFEQVEGAAARGGTGLGLAISKKLAHLLGGDLSVQSEPGKGSTFTLRIPRRPTEEGAN